MKTLLLLRHAKSAWDSPGARDFDRTLAPRGERDAPRVGKALRASEVQVDAIVASPAARATRTAELVRDAAKLAAPLHFDEAIYEASLSTLFAVVRGLDDDADSVMLVGHNPGCEELFGALVGPKGSPASVRVATSTLACFDIDADRWRDVCPGCGTLRWMLVPRLLG